MEKLGVVLDESLTKTSTVGSNCPECGMKLTKPQFCNTCGTKPFEKRPEDSNGSKKGNSSSNKP